MKFWKNIANTLDRRKRQSMASSTNSDSGLTNDSPTPSATRRRRSQYSRSDYNKSALQFSLTVP